MNQKSIDIIGGGIAGLALGIHLQKNGFRTHIYEQHHTPGGLCTGWKRAGYTFNGCLHWLLGTQPGISFYWFWREIFDVDSLRFHHFSERTQFTVNQPDARGERVFHYLNDIDEFQRYLLLSAPEDEKLIRQWTDAVRFITPLLDYLPPVFTDCSIWQKIRLQLRLIKLLRILPFMHIWGKISTLDFALRFRSPFLREAVKNLYDNEMRMTVVLFAHAYASKHVAAYPIGGSLDFSLKLAENYTALGGTLHLDTPVKRIITRDGQAIGLETHKHQRTRADFVVSCADWHWTVFTALGGQFVEPKLQPLREPKKEQIFYSFCMLHLGLKAEMTSMPHFFRFPIDTLHSPDGTEYQKLEVHIYNYDPTLAPQGKCCASVNLTTREGDYWINLRRTSPDKYRERKDELKALILKALDQHLGHTFIDAIEVAELATPATYHRYTSNLRGSSQGWTPMNDITKRNGVKCSLPGLKHFLMASHWMEAGGGLPVALISARKAAWTICRTFGQPFRTADIKEFIN